MPTSHALPAALIFKPERIGTDPRKCKVLADIGEYRWLAPAFSKTMVSALELSIGFYET